MAEFGGRVLKSARPISGVTSYGRVWKKGAGKRVPLHRNPLRHSLEEGCRKARFGVRKCPFSGVTSLAQVGGRVPKSEAWNMTLFVQGVSICTAGSIISSPQVNGVLKRV